MQGLPGMIPPSDGGEDSLRAPSVDGSDEGVQLAPKRAQTKELPDMVKRRRPSLASVLTDDNRDGTYQQQLALKVHQASVNLASGDGGGSPRQARSSPASAGRQRTRWDVLAVIKSRGMPIIVALSAAICCLLVFAQEVLTEAVVHRGVEGVYMQHYSLNEPVGAFIGVVAFIFALLYTSTYNDAQQRLSSIRNSLAQEAGGVHTAMLLVRTLDADDNVNKMRALLLFSSYIENLATEIFFKHHPKKVSSNQQLFASSIESLYAAIPFLAEIGSDGEGDEMDRVLIQRTVDALNRVCEARHNRISEERHDVSFFTFSFLSMLALFTFYGTLFLQFGSKELSTSVVIMTATSLMVAMLVLMDVSMPWFGFITVDVGIFTSIRNDISLVLVQEQGDVQDDADGLKEDSDEQHANGRSASSSPAKLASGEKSVRLSDRGRMDSTQNISGVTVNHMAHLEQAIKRRGSMCFEEEDLNELNALRPT